MVVAHRGAWRSAGLPHNSLAALRRAIVLGCHASECDVQLTADNLLVVCHDAQWGGLPVATTDYARLRRQPLANGETLPLLADFLREITAAAVNAAGGAAADAVKGAAGGDGAAAATKLVIELKDSSLGRERTLEAVGMLLGEVAAAGAGAHAEYILFNYEAALMLIATEPQAHVSYLEGDALPQQLKADGFAGLDYPLAKLQESPQWLAQARGLGLATNAWTVNQRADMLFLLDHGISRITTDEPELLLQLLQERSDAENVPSA